MTNADDPRPSVDPFPPAPVVVLASTPRHSRRGFGQQLLLGLTAIGAALVTQPQEAEARGGLDYWRMDGNTFVSRHHFIGSRNNAALIFKTNNTERMRITREGQIGVNTASPASAFHAVTTTTPIALRGDSTSTDYGAAGVVGAHPSTGIGVFGQAGNGGIGVRGICDLDYSGIGVAGHGGRTGTGVYGSGVYGIGVHGVVSGGDFNVGVRGEANPDARSTADLEGIGVEGISGSGVGVIGRSNATYGIGVGAIAPTGTSTGVQGVGSFIGVLGSSATTPGNIGVFGFSALDAPSGVSAPLTREGYELRWPFDGLGPEGTTGVRGIGTAVGVSGLAENSNGIGVLGVAYPIAENSYAGYFAGQVAITDQLRVEHTVQSPVAGFAIAHPVTPESHTLHHAFVAAPGHQVCYSGNVLLDAGGSAVVSLPAYATALATDFRYQLTPIGGPMPNLHVAQPISDGQFTVAGGTPGLTVSWQVIGVRQDNYVSTHPLVVEQPKNAG
jgi:hypothetical protein